MTRRKWNERECEVGGTTRRRLVSILFPISREADKIHAAMLTIRKRDGRFNVARHVSLKVCSAVRWSWWVVGAGERRDWCATKGVVHGKKKGPVRVFDLRVRFGKFGVSGAELGCDCAEAGTRGGD